MIAVIADDITGAAELAGIGLNYRLSTELSTSIDPGCQADLLIIAANTRSLPVSEAKKITYDVTCQLLELKPKLIFKKIDSVLRGNILEEVNSQMEASGLNRALIIPGNPSLGKKIIDGFFYYNNKPLHLSRYSTDPEFPAKSSDIREILGADKIRVLKKHQQLPGKGIIIGEVAVESDFNHWVEKAGDNILLAGASGLFNSLLNYLKPLSHGFSHKESSVKLPRLFVFGSGFNTKRHKVINNMLNQISLCYIPEDIIYNENVSQHLYADFSRQIAGVLKENGSCIMAIRPDMEEKNIDPALLASKMGTIVKNIYQRITLNELLIEGGATAAAVLKKLNITTLHPDKCISPGVIRMRIPGNDRLHITLKPGSYEWPPMVWQPVN